MLSSPNFTDYTATWTTYINGALAPNLTTFTGSFPLPVYRPLSYIGGSDYRNANLPMVMDAFRIYDYALSASTVTQVYNTLYNPATAAGASSSTGGSASLPSSSSRGPSVSSSTTVTPTLSSSSPTANPTASISTSSSSSGTASAASVSNSGSSGLSHGAIAGIVIGAVVGAILVLVLLMVICFGRSRSKGNKLEDHHTTHHGGHDVDDSESPAEVEMGPRHR